VVFGRFVFGIKQLGCGQDQLKGSSISEYIVLNKIREKYLYLLKQIRDTMSTAPYVIVQRTRQPYRLDPLCNGGYVGSMLITLGGFYIKEEQNA